MISPPSQENVLIWESILLARRDPGRSQARFQQAGNIFSHVNTCDILCYKVSASWILAKRIYTGETFSIRIGPELVKMIAFQIKYIVIKHNVVPHSTTLATQYTAKLREY